MSARLHPRAGRRAQLADRLEALGAELADIRMSIGAAGAEAVPAQDLVLAFLDVASYAIQRAAARVAEGP